MRMSCRRQSGKMPPRRTIIQPSDSSDELLRHHRSTAANGERHDRATEAAAAKTGHGQLSFRDMTTPPDIQVQSNQRNGSWTPTKHQNKENARPEVDILASPLSSSPFELAQRVPTDVQRLPETPPGRASTPRHEQAFVNNGRRQILQYDSSWSP